MQLSAGEKIATVVASDSYFVGGYWGFILKDNPDYTTHLELLRKAEKNKPIEVIEVANGLIVEVSTDMLNSTIMETVPELKKSANMQQKILKLQNERYKEEQQKSLKFLETVVQKTSQYGIEYDGFKEYSIGVYSTNELSKIQLNGLKYPAFKLTVHDMYDNLKKVRHFMKVYVKTKIGETVEFKELANIHNFGEVIKALEISNTNTGVFITIRVEN